MPARTVIAGVALVLTISLAIALLADLAPEPSSRSRTTSDRTATVPAPSRMTRAQINRQDRTSKRQARREARVFDSRPLLSALPTVRDGVSFDIGGLSRNADKTVIVIDSRGQGRRWALRTFRALRRSLGDRFSGYELEVHP
jgi:hypothetical protein